MASGAAVWRVGQGRTLDLDRPRLVAIVNVTPDSFSDGGTRDGVAAHVEYGKSCLQAGADVLDIGGESTRPGAARVTPEEQITRVVPVIERLVSDTDALLSVDTTRAAVADAALGAGAHIVNDVSAGREEPALLEIVAARRAGIVLMHRRVPPDEDSYSDEYAEPPVYADVVREVVAFLAGRARAARERAGIGATSIVLDPGLGFGKSVEQNYALIAASGAIAALGYPVLGAASRKSFVGRISGVEPPDRRLAGSLAVAVAQALAGIRLFRVHDVAAHREALAVAHAIAAAQDGGGGGGYDWRSGEGEPPVKAGRVPANS